MLDDCDPPPKPAGKREGIRVATTDSTVALTFALIINAAIPILSAATFHSAGNAQVAEIEQAHPLLAPTRAIGAASVVLALALLASGQSSTITAILAGGGWRC